MSVKKNGEPSLFSKNPITEEHHPYPKRYGGEKWFTVPVDKVDHAIFHTIAGDVTGEELHYNDANSRISQMNETEKNQFFELVNDIEVRKKVIKIIGFEE
jgi:L-cysteine desulfidase